MTAIIVPCNLDPMPAHGVVDGVGVGVGVGFDADSASVAELVAAPKADPKRSNDRSSITHQSSNVTNRMLSQKLKQI